MAKIIQENEVTNSSVDSAHSQTLPSKQKSILSDAEKRLEKAYLDLQKQLKKDDIKAKSEKIVSLSNIKHPELKKYVHAQLNNGFSKEKIKGHLKSNGWAEEHLDF